TEAGVVTIVYLTLRQADQIIAFVSIAWKVAHTFTADETTYLNALPSLLAPVIANLKSLQGMAESNERLAVLNHISTQLSAASNLEDLLEVLVEPLSGNFTASVSYPKFDDSGAVKTLSLASQLDSSGRPAVDVPAGTEFPLDTFPSIKRYINTPSGVTMIADVYEDKATDASSKAFYEQMGIRANAYLALRQAAQVIAFVNVAWLEPHLFSPDEQAYLQALPALLAPVVANLQSLDRVSRTNDHLALINRIGKDLKAAEAVGTILDIILEPLSQDAIADVSRPIYDTTGTMTALEIIANHNQHNHRLNIDVGTVIPVENYMTLEWYLIDPDRVKFVADVANDPNVDEAAKALCIRLGIGAQVYITLQQADKVIALLSLTWPEAHEFSNDEQMYISALPSLLSPVMANRQALDNLAQSNASLATINHIGSQLKAADSKDKMLEILLEPLPESTVASLFYADDVNSQNQVTVTRLVSQHSNSDFKAMPVGTSVNVLDHPLAELWVSNPEGISIVEDTQSLNVSDESAQLGFDEYNIKKLVSVPLMQSNEWIGFLILTWNHRYNFSNQELTYLNALPTMLTPPLANRRMVENLEETVAKRSEELAKSRQLMRATIDNAPLVIYVKDMNMHYALANTNVHLVLPGQTPQSIIGLSDHDVLPADIADQVRESDRQVIATKQAIMYEATRNFNGDTTLFLVNKFPMLDDDGNVFALGTIANDITKQREQERDVQAYRDQLAQAEAELQVTQRIQELLLPADDELDAIHGLDIASYMKPAEQVGGDYYDILQIGDSVKFGIGDVTGHGLESGLLMLMTQTAVRTLLASNEHDPKRIMNILNQTVFDNLQRMQVDKSLTLSLLDYDQGTLRLSGQHEHVLIIRGNGTVEAIDTIDLGMPLGLEEDISHFIAEKMVHLDPGEGVVLFTDGITEAENDAREQFGLGRLITLIEQRWQQPAQAITDAIVQAVYDHVDGHTIYDDITLVVFKRPSGDFARSLMPTQDVATQPHIK
ncbi:MAG: SpoIIE family protein phosphatase, partial [Deinococcota bacterium]